MTADAVFNFLRNHRGLPIRSMTIFNFLLEAALSGAIMVLLVVVIRRFFRKQVGSRAICFAWLLIALRLLVPLALPNPLMDELRPTYSVDEAARPVADQFRVRFQDAVSDLAWKMTREDRAAWREAGLSASEYPYTLGEFVSDVGAYTSYGWTGKWFLFAYLAIAGCIGCFFLIRALQELHVMKQRRYLPLSAEDEQEYHAICQELNIRPLPAYYVGSIQGARILGLWKPYVAIASTLKPADTHTALLHALLSYKGHEHWWHLLRKVCCAVQWFNPFVWLGAWLCRKDLDLAREEEISQAEPAPSFKQLRTVFCALCCLVLLASWFTAESTPLARYKAAENAALDAMAVLPHDILNEKEAIALAQTHILSPLLQPGSFHGICRDADFCAYKDGYGWHVSMISSHAKRFLLLSEQGELRDFDTGIDLSALETLTLDLPSDQADTLTSITRAYAKQHLNTAIAGSVAPTRAGIINGLAHCEVAFTAGNESCTMIINMDEGVVAGFTMGEGHGPGVTQKDVLPLIRQYLMQELGVNDDQARMTLQRVMAGNHNGKRVLLGIISEQPAWMSTEAAARLEKLYGKQDRYAFQLVIDPASGVIIAVEFLPQATYDNETQVLSTQTAAQTMTTYELIQKRYLVQASSLPAGTSFDIISVANIYADQLVPTGGAMGVENDMTLVRFTHPANGKEVYQWVRASDITNNAYLEVLQARDIVCTVDGQQITLKGYDYQYHDGNVDGFYGDPPEDAATIEQAAAAALAAIQAEYGIAPQDFEPLPVYFGFYHNRESADNPLIYWRIDLPDPRSSNMDFEVYLNTDGSLKDLFGPEDGNG